MKWIGKKRAFDEKRDFPIEIMRDYYSYFNYQGFHEPVKHC